MPNPSYFIEHKENDVGTTCLGMTKDTHGGTVADRLLVGGPPTVPKAEAIDKCSFTSLQVSDEKTLTVFPSLHMPGSEPFEDPS